MQIKKYLSILIMALFLTSVNIYSMSDDYNYYNNKKDKITNEIDNDYNEENESFKNEQENNYTNDYTNTNTSTNEDDINLAIVVVDAIVKVDWLGDKSASNRALVDAQKKAITTTVEHILNSGVILSDFDSKKSKLTRDYKNYIKEYSIITNEKTDNSYRTQIEAVVEYAIIKKYLLSEGVLNDENIQASISIVTIEDKANLNNIFSEELKKLLEEDNFYILPNNEILYETINSNNINYDNILNEKELNIIASHIANEQRSKYSVIGNVAAVFVTQIEGTSLFTSRSTIYLDIIDTANMKSITNIVYQTSGTSGSIESSYNFVLKKSAKYAADEITKTINKDIELNKTPREYMLIVEGLSYEDSLLLQKEIKNNIERVKNVYNYGEIDNKQSLVVSFVGDIKSLAVELNVKARNIGFRIIIDNYDDTNIYLSAKKR